MPIKVRGIDRIEARLANLAAEQRSLVSKEGSRYLVSYLRAVSPRHTGFMRKTIIRKRKRGRWMVVIPESVYPGWFYPIKFAKFFRKKSRQFKTAVVARIKPIMKRKAKENWESGRR